MAGEGEERPEVSVELVGQPSGGGPWHTTFRVTNVGKESIDLRSAWMPHVVLHAEEIDLSQSSSLAPEASMELEFEVTYAPRDAPYEPPNPFLFLRLRWHGEEWRLVVQLSISSGQVPPKLAVARINAHRIGFSSGLS